MTRAVRFPDILPDPEVVNQMTFVDGDFMQAFVGQEETFSIIVTLFFIDTSPNVISTIGQFF